MPTLPASSSEDVVTVYAEQYFPFNFRGQSGDVTGLATTLVRQVMEQSGLRYEIRIGPWTRIYRAAQSNDNTLLFSIAKTPKRSAQFDWLVPLFADEYHLMAPVENNNEITAAKIKAGVVAVAEEGLGVEGQVVHE